MLTPSLFPVEVGKAIRQVSSKWRQNYRINVSFEHCESTVAAALLVPKSSGSVQSRSHPSGLLYNSVLSDSQKLIMVDDSPP